MPAPTPQTLDQSVEPKAPAEIKTYTMDWSVYLAAGVTVSTSSWAVTPAGVSVSSSAIAADGRSATALLAGGAAGNSYLVENTITTSDGETLVRTGRLVVRRV